MQILIKSVQWRLTMPFAIARGVQTTSDTIHVELTDAAGRRGHAEAAGVDYAGETVAAMTAQLEALRDRLGEVDELHPAEVQDLLPAGGARNALDCALWDLRAKQRGVAAWQELGLKKRERLACAYTIGIDPVDVVAAKARERRRFPLLKLKVNAESHLQLIEAVRAEAPDAKLIVDANASWSAPLLEELMPALVQHRVSLLEQPLAPGADGYLAGRRYPVPLGADESCVDRTSIREIVGRYQYANLKLDKTGGLTEAMACARLALSHGLGLMVGNMCGSSLAMAPGALLATLCEYVDLDGPLLQLEDVPHALRFADGWMSFPEPALWG
jgi:L-Ala-D/L-Glu epimerase